MAKKEENTISKPVVIALLIGLIAGFLVGRLRYKPQIETLYNMVKIQDSQKMQMMSNDHTMNGMVKTLEGKKGDEFDKEFITLMIEHHLGAIEMAKQAQENSKHQELKTLAGTIITTQTQEITTMKSWWQEWYKK